MANSDESKKITKKKKHTQKPKNKPQDIGWKVYQTQLSRNETKARLSWNWD